MPSFETGRAADGLKWARIGACACGLALPFPPHVWPGQAFLLFFSLWMKTGVARYHGKGRLMSMGLDCLCRRLGWGGGEIVDIGCFRPSEVAIPCRCCCVATHEPETLLRAQYIEHGAFSPAEKQQTTGSAFWVGRRCEKTR